MSCTFIDPPWKKFTLNTATEGSNSARGKCNKNNNSNTVNNKKINRNRERSLCLNKYQCLI